MFNLCLLTLIFIETFSFSHCVLNVISRCKFCKNGFFNTFFPLSHTFYFETRPSLLSKIGENAFGAHFLQLYGKNEYGDPYFLFHYFNKDSASFRWEKNWHKSMFSFCKRVLNSRICQHCDVKTRTMTPTFWLVTSVHQVLATIFVRFFYYGITLKLKSKIVNNIKIKKYIFIF